MTMQSAINQTAVTGAAKAAPRPHRDTGLSAQFGDVEGMHSLEALPPLRLFHVFAGAVLVIAAFGIWLVPGQSWNEGAKLVKVFMSAASLIVGFSFLIPMHRRYPEVQLDPRAERLDVIERNDFGRISSSKSYDYADLSEVDVRDGIFIAKDHQGRTVVELPLTRRVDEIEALRAALGPSFSRTA